MTDKTKKEGEALATPAPEQKTGGVVSSIGDKLLCYADEHPLKTTVGLTIAGGVAKERIIDPVLDWTISKVGGLFARGAEEKVEEKLADEAVAAASGGVIDCAFNVISKAFDGVVD
jgi:hypothetical protein